MLGASDFFVLDRMAQNLDDDVMEKVIMMNSVIRSEKVMMMRKRQVITMTIEGAQGDWEGVGVSGPEIKQHASPPALLPKLNLVNFPN